MFCSPYPDEIDWEKERAKTKPETIVNSLKAQEAKDLIKSYVADDIVIKTKSDVLSFLKNNPELFEKIRDRRIQERWDSKPHRTEASKEEIATLLAWTVWGRMSFIRNVVRCLSLGMKYRVYWLEDHGKLFKSTLNNRLHRNLACVIDKSSRGAKLKRAFEELPMTRNSSKWPK